MQDCFRQHPDVYGAELADDEDDGDTATAPEGTEVASAKEVTDEPAAAKATPETAQSADPKPVEADGSGQHQQLKEHTQEVPKSAFDATDANKGKE